MTEKAKKEEAKAKEAKAKEFKVKLKAYRKEHGMLGCDNSAKDQNRANDVVCAMQRKRARAFTQSEYFKTKLLRHKKQMKCSKEYVEEQRRKKKLCRPAGTKRGAQGAAAVVELHIGTNASCSGKYTSESSRWKRYWDKQEIDKRPESCKYTIAMTLTKKADMSVTMGPGADLVQSYAAVADARPVYNNNEVPKCCESDARVKGKDWRIKSESRKVKGLAPCTPCQNFIWLADSIARDALGETRFHLAEQLT